ncbi:hypothetical protein AJ87_17970 [Rhizobium yanglingense]|nr:hypothetical protein AJ87_17970 [Rhizobium yanglingense]
MRMVRMITSLRPAGHRPHREGDRLVALALSMGGPFSPAGGRGPEGSDEGVGSAYGIRRLRSRRSRPAPLAPLGAALLPAGEKRRKL